MVAAGASLLIVAKHNQPVGVWSAHDWMLTPPRRQADIPAVVTVFDEHASQQQASNATIVRLSHVGARLESATGLGSRTRVMLAFSLPGHNAPLTIHGKVLSCGSFTAGAADAPGQGAFAIEVQFADPSHTDMARLKAWALQAMPSTPDQA